MPVISGTNALQTCDSRLIKLIESVAADTEIEVIQGHRSHTEAMHNVATGHSHTLHSKHECSPAKAVDCGPKGTRAAWAQGKDLPGEAYVGLSNKILSRAKQLGLKIRWGGDWDMKGDGNKVGQLNDLVHYELMED